MRNTIIILIVLILIGLGYFYTRDKEDKLIQMFVPENPVRLTNPHSNDLITSPLTVTGEAKGNWYFEASFPIKIFDANGKQLGVIPAQAQGDWMTTEFVPFETKLVFSTPISGQMGTLVLQKDNPSGLR
mgnify:CR=1 FL=1